MRFTEIWHSHGVLTLSLLCLMMQQHLVVGSKVSLVSLQIWLAKFSTKDHCKSNFVLGCGSAVKCFFCHWYLPTMGYPSARLPVSRSTIWK